MSCNGCRVLRKGCSESCILRPCLQWIESPEAQGHATVFVAKFFGRAGLMSFISAVPEPQRPALFQSLLFEACGRTVNPVKGAVGLLSTGNWHVCQAAVETVLRGGALRALPELDTSEQSDVAEMGGAFEICQPASKPRWSSFSSIKKRKGSSPVDVAVERSVTCDLDLCLTPAATVKEEKLRPGTPSMNSEESVTTSEESEGDRKGLGHPRLLNLFV